MVTPRRLQFILWSVVLLIATHARVEVDMKAADPATLRTGTHGSLFVEQMLVGNL